MNTTTTMKYAQLGRTGLQVSRLCLGTMNFGPRTSDEESFAIMDRALDLGLNFWDTANVYGGKLGAGATEEVLGRYFAQGGGRREKVVLATKLFIRMTDWPNGGGLSALHIRQACEASLRRMQTDYIDLYQMHHVCRLSPWEEIWQAMELLVQQGKVVYIGSSNFAGWHIAKASEAARRRNFLGLVSEQCVYNLNNRAVERDLIPACEDYGLGVIPWSPLAGGLLAGGVSDAEPGSRRSEIKASEEDLTRIARWEVFCRELGEQPADIALAWLLHKRAVTSPIIGPRTLAQFEGNLHALDIRLSEETLARLDEIFPGHKTSPENHAW